MWLYNLFCREIKKIGLLGAPDLTFPVACYQNDLINQKFDLVKKTKLIKIRTVVSFYGGGCFYNCNLKTLNF